MLKPSEIEATARAYHAQSEIIAGMAHNSMLKPRWQTVADRILMWLKEQGSSERLQPAIRSIQMEHSVI